MAIRLPELPGEKEDMIEWAWKRLPIDFGGPELAYPIAVFRDSLLVCVVVYHNWRGVSVEMSIAADSPRWASKETIQFLLGWAFNTYNVRRITAIVKRGNARSRKLVDGLGFRTEGTLLDAFEDDDAVICGMTRRWYERSRWFIEWPEADMKKVA